jgi:hypothetical protein
VYIFLSTYALAQEEMETVFTEFTSDDDDIHDEDNDENEQFGETRVCRYVAISQQRCFLRSTSHPSKYKRVNRNQEKQKHFIACSRRYHLQVRDFFELIFGVWPGTLQHVYPAGYVPVATLLSELARVMCLRMLDVGHKAWEWRQHTG